MADEPLIIGWRERVDLPEWGVTRLLAKADTGARSSAVHAERIEKLSNGRVVFDVVYSRAHPEHFARVESEIVREAHVRSSSGHGDERLFVRTLLRAGAFEREVEMTLVSR
ncbi:MAG: RimK/LysX family protein [Planctomycetota bacterium]